MNIVEVLAAKGDEKKGQMSTVVRRMRMKIYALNVNLMLRFFFKILLLVHLKKKKRLPIGEEEANNDKMT